MLYSRVYNKLNCCLRIDQFHFEGKSSIDLPSEQAKKLVDLYPKYLQIKNKKNVKKNVKRND
jgi:hypothetical protein